jgi:hypothetical protein
MVVCATVVPLINMYLRMFPRNTKEECRNLLQIYEQVLLHIRILKLFLFFLHLSMMLPSISRSPKWSLDFRFPAKTFYTFLTSLCETLALLIASSLILTPKQYLVKSEYKLFGSSIGNILHPRVISSLVDPNEQLFVLSKAIRVFYDHANFMGRLVFIATLHIHVPHSATENITALLSEKLWRRKHLV